MKKIDSFSLVSEIISDEHYLNYLKNLTHYQDLSIGYFVRKMFGENSRYYIDLFGERLFKKIIELKDIIEFEMSEEIEAFKKINQTRGYNLTDSEIYKKFVNSKFIFDEMFATEETKLSSVILYDRLVNKFTRLNIITIKDLLEIDNFLLKNCFNKNEIKLIKLNQEKFTLKFNLPTTSYEENHTQLKLIK